MNQEHTGDLTRLIVLAGLAIPIRFDDLTADSSWALQTFQAGEPPLFLEHLRYAIELAGAQRDALLLFSGTQSRVEAEPSSEGQGYFLAAEHEKWFHRPSVKLRTSTEEFARDSFENPLFSICRFRECVGRYPETITVVGYAFKQRRFDMHRAAIRFPESRWTYCGPNNPPNLSQAEVGEAQARQDFTEDPYGTGERLAAKRQSRNPFRRQHGYSVSCPELRDLLSYRGTDLYPGPLPWG